MISDDTTTVQTEVLDRLESRTDWGRLRNPFDAGLEAAIRSAPDAALLDADGVETATSAG